MKRQNLRQGILLISFLLLPITQFYFSPYIIVDAAANGVLNGSLLMFLFFIVAGLFVGRALCGWIMPCGGLQESCFSANSTKVKGGKFNLIKYFIWVLWLLIIIGMVIRYGGYYTVDPFYKINHGISVSAPVMYIIYYGVILIILVLAFTLGKRACCHYICWMAPFMVIGRKIGTLLKLPSLHLVSDPSKCKSCNQCSLNCPMSLDVANMVNRQKMDNSECILCGTCVDGCKEKAIKYRFGFLSKNNKHNLSQLSKQL